MMKSDNNVNSNKADRRRRLAEPMSSVGIILIAVALAVPLFDMTSTVMLGIFKWVYAAGAVVFTTARVIGAQGPSGTMRLRRLRRMEFWAGAAFILGGAFWFYNESRFSASPNAGSLAILQETIMFSLVGAVVQIAASWMIYAQEKKEKDGGNRN